MNFFTELDKIMKQDMGGRGLLGALPANPVKQTLETLKDAKRVILLSGFPVRMADGTYIGETDGPSGTANLAYALSEFGADVLVITDKASYGLFDAALSYRAPKANLMILPETDTDLRIWEIAPFSNRETWAWEIPKELATSIWVRPS